MPYPAGLAEERRGKSASRHMRSACQCVNDTRARSEVCSRKCDGGRSRVTPGMHGIALSDWLASVCAPLGRWENSLRRFSRTRVGQLAERCCGPTCMMLETSCLSCRCPCLSEGIWAGERGAWQGSGKACACHGAGSWEPHMCMRCGRSLLHLTPCVSLRPTIECRASTLQAPSAA